MGINFGRMGATGTGSASTALNRESDGTVTVTSVGAAWTPTITRQEDGTVSVS